MTTRELLDEVRAERIRQDVKWGGAEHDDAHSVNEWARLIRDRCEDLSLFYEVGPVARRRFLEVAALAMAAIESIDRKGDNVDV